MQMPIKQPHSLIPKMFKVFSVYIIMTLAVFFGYVQIFGELPPVQITLPSEDASAEDDSYFGAFVANMGTFKNIDTNVSLQVNNLDTQLKANGNVVFDMGTNNISLALLLNYNGNDFDIKATYIAPNLYLGINGATYIFNTESEMDLSGLIGFISKNINIDTSFIDDIGNALGIDLTNLDPNALLSKLSIEEKKLDAGGYEFNIGLGNLISAKMVCDEEFNIVSVNTKDILIEGNAIKISADVNRMNKDDIVVDYVETGAEIDMSDMTKYVDYAKNTFSNEFISGNININVDGKDYDIVLNTENVNGFKALLKTNIEGLNIVAGFKDNNLYLTLDNVNVKFNVDDYPIWEEKINAILKNSCSKDAYEIIKMLLKKYANLDLDSINTQETIISIVTGLLGSEGNLTTYLPKETKSTENDFEMLWDNGMKVVLSQAEQQLSSIKCVASTFNFDVVLTKSAESVEIVDNHYDLSKLLPFVEVVNEIVLNKKLESNIVVNYADYRIDAKLIADFSNDLLAEIKANVLDEEIAVYLKNYEISLKVGDIIIKGDLNNLDAYLIEIDNAFGTSISSVNKQDETQTEKVQKSALEIIKQIHSILVSLTINSNDDVLAIVKYLNNEFDLNVENGVALLSFVNDKLNVNATLTKSDKVVAIPEMTNNIEALLDKISAVKKYIDTKIYSFDFNFKYNNIDISGLAKIDLIKNSFEFSNIILGKNQLNVRYENDIVYVDYAGNKLKCNVVDIQKLLNVVKQMIPSSQNQILDLSNLMIDLFGQDISKMKLNELISLVSVDFAGDLDLLDIKLGFKTTKPRNANVMVAFDKTTNMIDNIVVGIEGINLTMNVAEVKESKPVADSEYYNLIDKHSGNLILSVKDGDKFVDINVNVEIDLSEKIFVKLSTIVMNENVEVIISNNMIYANIGELSYATSFENVPDLVDYVIKAFDIVIPKTEINIEQILKDLDLNGIDVLANPNMILNITSNKLDFSYLINPNLKIDLKLNSGVVIGETVLPVEYSDLKSLITKAESIKNYIQKGIFEIEFKVNYNGLDLNGTLKYFNKVLEISNMKLGDECLDIRLQDNFLYISYGVMKFKFDISSETQVQQLSTAVADTTGVVIDFGIFQELIDIYKNYTLTDYINKLVCDLSGDLNSIVINLANQQEFVLSQILNASLVFEAEKLTTLNLNVYGILSAEIKVLSVENSTIPEFVPDNFKDYATNYVDELFESLKVEEQVYALSSDISIRYSTNQFYGNISAMLIENQNYNGALGHFIPAISVYTNSLGLNTYIYLIENMLYVDVNGLTVKADLTQQTIDEILTYLETKFGLSLGNQNDLTKAVAETFKVILPAIDKIYGTWITELTSTGIKVNINDDLWYSETSRFYDIVLQVLISNKDHIINPTQLVFGANIEDPNTKVYDDYSKYWLNCEETMTQKLNFAVYLNNIISGKNIVNLKDTFELKRDVQKEVVAVKTNNGMVKLSDFNSYQTLIELVDTVYDYGTSFKYQLNMVGEIAGSTSTTSLGGDVILEIGDLADKNANNMGIELFNGKYLKVQGDLDITSNAVQHLINLLYESNEPTAFYATYTHGAEIAAGNKFRAKIDNANLSEIVSMVLKFMNVNLGDSMNQSLNLKPCTTDFRYLQSLLGIVKTDVSGDISKVDKLLSSVESITKMIKSVNLTKSTIQNELEEMILSVVLDLEGKLATINVVIRDEVQVDGTILKQLKEINISNLVMGTNTLNLKISIQDFDPINFDYDKTVKHMNLSAVSSFMDVVVSTLNTKGVNFKGSTNVSVPVVGDIGVGFDVFIGTDENEKFYMYIELDVASKREVTWSAFGTETTYTTKNVVAKKPAWDKRISTLEYKNDILNIVNTTYNSRNNDFATPYDDVKKYTYRKDEIGANLMLIITQSIGFTNTVHKAIEFAVKKMNPSPTVEQGLLGFEDMGTKYGLSLNMQNLTGMNGFANTVLNIGVSDVYNTNVNNADLGVYEKGHRFIDSVKTTLDISGAIIIPLTLESVAGDSYVTGGGRTLYTNDHYRKQYLNSIGIIA